MIKSFKDKEAEKLFRREFSQRLPKNIQPIALRKLRMIDNSLSINDLRVPPANRLKKLTGRRKGQYSIRINNKWRICFVWKEKDAYKVKITDCH